MCVDFNCNGHQHSAAPLLFFAGFAFWLAAVLSCLQWFPFLFAAHQSFLFAAVSFSVCSGSFLFGAFVFCCSLFCLQRVPCGTLYHLITHTYLQGMKKEGEKKKLYFNNCLNNCLDFSKKKGKIWLFLII